VRGGVAWFFVLTARVRACCAVGDTFGVVVGGWLGARVPALPSSRQRVHHTTDSALVGAASYDAQLGTYVRPAHERRTRGTEVHGGR
jgi:hypothetical protein